MTELVMAEIKPSPTPNTSAATLFHPTHSPYKIIGLFGSPLAFAKGAAILPEVHTNTQNKTSHKPLIY
jgi:hypothetical protein